MKVGRPKLPKGKSKEQLIGIRISIDELWRCRLMAKKDEVSSISKWARLVLMKYVNQREREKQ